MLGVADHDMGLAVQKLINAGFREQTWSFSSTVDPATRENDEIYKRIRESLRPGYVQLDCNSTRFEHPDVERCPIRMALLPFSYLCMMPPNTSNSSNGTHGHECQPSFYNNKFFPENLYIPNPAILLRSIIKVILNIGSDEVMQKSYWRMTLITWAMGCLYGGLNLRDDVLNDCQDIDVVRYYNQEVEKAGRGEDRTVVKNGIKRPFITNDMIRDFQ
jgi:hypothetical protein